MIMKFYFSIREGINSLGGVKSRGGLRSALGIPFEVLPKTKFSRNSSDVFGGAVLRAWYDERDLVTGVEIYHPAAEFFFEKAQLLGVSVGELEEFMKNLGVDLLVDKDGTGFSIYDDSIRFYVPDLEEMKAAAKIKAIYLDASRIFQAK
jgi:hypothetical protein